MFEESGNQPEGTMAARTAVLMQNQEETGQAIEDLIRNVRKDSKDRKTRNYYGRKSQQMRELLQAFQINHVKISGEENIPADHNYVKKDYYNKIKTIAETWLEEFEAEGKGAATLEGAVAKSTFATAKELVTTPKVTETRSSEAQNIDALLKSQQALMNSLIEIRERLSNEGYDIHKKSYYLGKSRLIIERLEKMEIINNQILSSSKPDINGYSEQKFLKFQEEMNEVVDEIQDICSNTETTKTPSSGLDNHTMPLPKIHIPKFDGTYSQWIQFKELFIELIHKRQIHDVQKMYYLSSFMTGEAKNLIKHLAMSPENYAVAWDIVTNRYDNKRLLVTALMNKFLSLPSTSPESSSTFKELHDITIECMLGLKAQGLPVDQWDLLIAHIIMKKLDKTTHASFEQTLTENKNPIELDTILRFLEHRFQSLEALGKGAKGSQKTSASAVKTESKCKICHNGDHQIYACPKFKNDTIANKWQQVKQLKLCCNCLKPGHKATDCKSGHCKLCEKRHNTTLHSNASKQPETENGNQQASSSTTSLLSGDVNNKYVLLGTARIIVTANNGQQVTCRAILDSGSQINVATMSLVKKLNAQTNATNLSIEGIGKTSKSSRHRVSLRIHSCLNKFSAAVDAHVLPQIVSNQPSQKIDTTKWKLPTNISLADPDFGTPDKIDLLLGAEFHHLLLRTGNMTIGKNLPTLQNSVFGWIVAGRVQETELSGAVCGICSNDELEEAISKFWKTEETTELCKPMTIAEKLCEEHFTQNTTSTETGRFIVRLPFSGDINLLGKSKAIAYNRLMALERRLSKNSELQKQYAEFMKEYEMLGHMSEIQPQNVKESHYFIPHHCVVRPESTSTKLRVVFDASAKTTTGVSLNELMYTGRTVQSELFSILLRFRMLRFVFKTDIEKMYRQIIVHQDDRKLQLIMWRNNSNQPVKYFELNTVTYGTRAAPFLATRCLEKIATDNMNKFPAGSLALRQNFYVDDGLAGADSIAEAIEIKNQLTTILKAAGMNPKKWSANTPKLMEDIAVEDQEINLDFDNNVKRSIKTLGLRWIPTTDEFCITTSIDADSLITKRQVTSELARIFDPLGLVAPVVVTAKIFIQQLWGLQLDWDAEIPPDLHRKWSSFRTNLQSLNNVKISRHIFDHQEKVSIQLHAFCDASERAYGACIYVRAIKRDKSVMVRLLCSKNRVAPLKTLTIPRLELCAAVLAAELMARIKTDLTIHDVPTHYWSDSQIVLSWINQNSTTFQAFVAHRVGKIQSLSIADQWRHVPSKQNPADILSRGINASELATTHIWFYGPLFLYQNNSTWEVPFQVKALEGTTLEKKQIALPATATPSLPLIHTIEARNSFRTLQRIVGYVLRFTKNLRTLRSSRPESLQLSPSELNASLKHIVKEIQASEFDDIIKTIRREKYLPSSHNLSSLSLFLDEEGILRVGGRLKCSSQEYDAKYQMLIHCNNPIVKLMIEAIHRENFHCATQSLMSFLQERFWPLNGKQVTRSVTHHCIRCRRTKPILYNQIMGQLPAARVEPARPFVTSGVDYCGPFKIHFNIRGRHPQKAYIAIFCCFATKAVHLELVSNLSTEAFIGALKRFIALRGHCKTLYSDNGTNFVGARNLIEDAVLSSSAQDKITKTCSAKGIEFKFIPPRSPHFGGLWEAAVKSAKYLLLRSTEAASLTDEQLRTAIAEVGAILNSRPLTPMSNDPNDLRALTPGHFLIGEPLTSTVGETLQQPPGTLQERWKRVTQIRTEFWDRWRKEYLSSLQHKHKWKGPITNIKEGTLVIIKEDNLPVLQWPLGRIVQIYRGNDDAVRVVDVKTEKGIFKRTIQRLAPLFPEDHQQSPARAQDTIEKDEIPCKRRRLKPNLLHVAIIALLLLPLVIGNPVNITKLADKPGLHFEEVGKIKIVVTNWNFIVFFDLEPFKNDIDTLKDGTTQLINICKSTQNAPPCIIMITQLQQVTQELESGFGLLSKRRKRGAVDIIGNMANSLFGVLDSNYEAQMSKTITHIQNNEEHLIKLLKNQTSFIDSTINIIKQDQTNVKAKFSEIDKRLNAITEELGHGATSALQSTQAAISLSIQLLVLSASLQKTRSAILDVLIDSHHGKVSPLLLTPKQFGEEIRRIKVHLPPHLLLPAMQENILQFYKIMEVDGTVADNHVIFSINLPLTDQRIFYAYYLTPISAIIKGLMTTIKIKTSWLAINDHRDEFFAMTEERLNSCPRLPDNTFLCSNVQSTLHKDTTPYKCELSLFNGEPGATCVIQSTTEDVVWHQLYDKNKWIFTINDTLRMTAVCNNQGDIISLKGTGILELHAACTLKSNDITIHGHQFATTTLHNAHSSIGVIATNFVKNFTDHAPLHEYATKIDELTRVQEKLAKHQIFDLPSNFHTSITHSLLLSYGSLGAVSCIILMIIVKFCLSQRKRQNTSITIAPPISRSRSAFDVATI